MLKASTQTKGESDPLKASVSLGCRTASWMRTPTHETIEMTTRIISSLALINDHAERGIAPINDATQSGRFRDEEKLQYALQVIEQNRSSFPDAKKSMLLENREIVN